MKQMIFLAMLVLGMHAAQAQQSTVRPRHPITTIKVALLTGLAFMVAPSQAQESPALSAYQACKKSCIVPFEQSKYYDPCDISIHTGARLNPRLDRENKEWYEGICTKRDQEYCMQNQVIPSIASLEQRLAELEKANKWWFFN